MYVAAGPEDYEESGGCGAYLDVTGPSGKVRVMIADKCPECESGHLDLSQEAFAKIGEPSAGVIKISYETVQDPPVPGPLAVRVKEGSSQHWTAFLIMNHGNPLTSVEYRDSAGTWQALERKPYNYWLASGGAGQGPYTLRIADTRGHRAVVDGISLTPSTTQTSSVMMYGSGSGSSEPSGNTPTSTPSTPGDSGDPVATPSQSGDPVATPSQSGDPMATSGQSGDPMATPSQSGDPMATSGQSDDPVAAPSPSDDSAATPGQSGDSAATPVQPTMPGMSAKPAIPATPAMPELTTAPPTRSGPKNGAACQANMTVVRRWPGGYLATVYVHNTGEAQNPWQVTWTLPAGARALAGWNAAVAQSKRRVSATAPMWNRNMPVGGSVSIGVVVSTAKNGPQLGKVKMAGTTCHGV